jgi:hypothetical protein
MSGSTRPLGTDGSPLIGTTPPEVHEDRAQQGGQPIVIDQNAQLFPHGEVRGGEISTTKIGRNALPNPNGIEIFGSTVERIGAPIELPKKVERGIAWLLGGLFANRGPLGDGKNIDDHRSTEAVRDAIADPPAAGPNALGPLTIYRPGLGNTAPGPAQIARLAQYTGKLIIAYANPGRGEETQLRPVHEVDGVLLPRELQGKVFAIGSPQNLMISFEQSSDVFLSQLDTMSKSPLLGGIDLKTSNATVVAHSQGGLDAVLTRKRLNDAGFDECFGKLGTMATPYKGSPVSDQSMFGIFAGMGERLFDLQAMGAVKKLDPEYVWSKVKDLNDLVDVSLVGHTDAGPEGRKDLRTFFKVSENTIEAVKSFASLFKGGDVRENDGLVTIASQLFGKIQHRLTKAYDHAGIAEDPKVIDQMAALLAR